MELVIEISNNVSDFHSLIMGHKHYFTASICQQEKARGSLRAHGLFTSVGRADRISDCEDFN